MTELVIDRVFDAPRDVVWRAFTDPDQLASWFGPLGFSVPRESVDLDVRTGGHQRLTMVNDHDPQQVSPIDAVFDEVVEGELLLGHEDMTEEMAQFFGTERMTLRIELSDDGPGRTRVVIRQGPFRDEFTPMARAGWNSSFVKLDNQFLVRLGLIPG